jgi:hypothetical protein
MKIGPIEENDSDEEMMPVNRRHGQNINSNTIPVTQSLNQNQIIIDRYLQKINKNEYNFLSSVKRYQTKS